MIFKAIEWTGASGVPEYDHEEVPQEDLWEDGELNETEVRCKVLYHTLDKCDWILVRRTDNG